MSLMQITEPNKKSNHLEILFVNPQAKNEPQKT